MSRHGVIEQLKELRISDGDVVHFELPFFLGAKMAWLPGTPVAELLVGASLALDICGTLATTAAADIDGGAADANVGHALTILLAIAKGAVDTALGGENCCVIRDDAKA